MDYVGLSRCPSRKGFNPQEDSDILKKKNIFGGLVSALVVSGFC